MYYITTSTVTSPFVQVYCGQIVISSRSRTYKNCTLYEIFPTLFINLFPFLAVERSKSDNLLRAKF